MYTWPPVRRGAVHQPDPHIAQRQCAATGCPTSRRRRSRPCPRCRRPSPPWRRRFRRRGVAAVHRPEVDLARRLVSPQDVGLAVAVLVALPADFPVRVRHRPHVASPTVRAAPSIGHSHTSPPRRVPPQDVALLVAREVAPDRAGGLQRANEPEQAVVDIDDHERASRQRHDGDGSLEPRRQAVAVAVGVPERGWRRRRAAARPSRDNRRSAPPSRRTSRSRARRPPSSTGSLARSTASPEVRGSRWIPRPARRSTGAPANR